MALKRGMNGSSEIGQHGTALLAACMDDGLEVGGEHIAALAATAVAALAPQDEAAQLALSVVVGRVDSAIVDEAPQRGAVLEDVLARAGDAGRGCALLEKSFDDCSQVPGELAELAAGHGPVADAVPVVEHHLRPQEELVADLAGLAAARREGRELAQQVGPFEPARPPYRDEPQIMLDPLNPQSDISDNVLTLFEEVIDGEPGVRERFVRHYEIWKQVVDDPGHPDHHKVRHENHDDPSFEPAYQPTTVVPRNQRCPCRSGKKYKNCCGRSAPASADRA